LPLNRAPLPSAAPDHDHYEVIVFASLVREPGRYTPQQIHAGIKK